MYLLINKKLSTRMLLLGLFFGLFVQTQSYCAVDGRMPYTVYGTVSRNIYEKQEDQLGFDDTQAFKGDNAYKRTIEEYGRDKFCITESAIPAKAEDSLRIMSFNVHNFHKICPPVKGELRKHPKYVAEIIGKINPDIVALEEIVPYAQDEAAAYLHLQKSILKHKEPGQIAVDFTTLDALMGKLGFTNNIKVNDFERHTNSDLKKIFMGKAIYTKGAFPIRAFSNSQIGHSSTNDRGYVSIVFEYDGKRILLYDVHLTFGNENVTRMEISELVGFIRKDKEKFGTENVIIVGDFNNNPYVEPQIFTALKKESYKLLNDMEPTAFNQNIQTGETIDLIYVSKGFLDNFEVLNTESKTPSGKRVVMVKSDASDHWPVFFDFKSKRLEASARQGAVQLQEPMQVAEIEESVGRIFVALKQKLFGKSSDGTQIIPDEKLEEVEVTASGNVKLGGKQILPIPPETKAQSLSHIRIYEDTKVIDKKTLSKLFDEIKNGYEIVSQEMHIKEEDIKAKAPDMDYLLKVTLNALSNEIKFTNEDNGYYVVYHAHDPKYSVLYDVYQQIYRWGLLNKEQQLALRSISPGTQQISGTQQSLNDFLKEASYPGFEGDMDPKVSSLIISVNLSLFGNMQSFTDSSFILGLVGRSWGEAKTDALLIQSLNNCNIGEEFGAKILRLNQKFFAKQKRGVLLQFFIKKNVIDNVIYLSNDGGKPFDDNIMPDFFKDGNQIWNSTNKSVDRISPFLEKFINDPQPLNGEMLQFTDKDQEATHPPHTCICRGKRSLDQVQARLWLPEQKVYDSKFVIVKRYNFDPQDHFAMTEYYKQLSEIFEEIIKDLIRNKLLNKIGSHGLVQTPLGPLEMQMIDDIRAAKSSLIKRKVEPGHVDQAAEKAQKETEVEDLFYQAGRQVSIDDKLQEKIMQMLTSPLYQKTLKNLPSNVTPLIMAAKMNSLPLVELLLSIDGYDPEFNAKDANGQTALYWANINASSPAGNRILARFIDYAEKHRKLLDSIPLSSIPVLAKVDSIKPVILKKFEILLEQGNPKVISIGKELIESASELELMDLFDKIFTASQNTKNHAALKLQEIIGEKFLDAYYKKPYQEFQESIKSADAAKIETLRQQAEKFIKSSSVDLQKLATEILNSIIRNDRANGQILKEAFAVVKQSVDSSDTVILRNIGDILHSLRWQTTVDKDDWAATVKSFIKAINKNFIETDEKFNHLNKWQQEDLLGPCLNLLDYLFQNLSKTDRGSEILAIAEKIVQIVKKKISEPYQDFILDAADRVSKLLEDVKGKAATKIQATFRGHKIRKDKAKETATTEAQGLLKGRKARKEQSASK